VASDEELELLFHFLSAGRGTASVALLAEFMPLSAAAA
jgi:hypothetical protein